MVAVFVYHIGVDDATSNNPSVFVCDISRLGLYRVAIEGVLTLICHAAFKVTIAAAAVINIFEIIIDMQRVPVGAALLGKDLPLTGKLLAYPAFKLLRHVVARDAAFLYAPRDELSGLHFEDLLALYVLIAHGLGISIGTNAFEAVKTHA